MEQLYTQIKSHAKKINVFHSHLAFKKKDQAITSNLPFEVANSVFLRLISDLYPNFVQDHNVYHLTEELSIIIYSPKVMYDGEKDFEVTEFIRQTN